MFSVVIYIPGISSAVILILNWHIHIYRNTNKKYNAMGIWETCFNAIRHTEQDILYPAVVFSYLLERHLSGMSYISRCAMTK